MFVVTNEIRQRLRVEVTDIMRGARPCGNLKVPAYLAGDGVKKPGMHPRSVANMMNPVDPGVYRGRRSPHDDTLD